MGQFMFVLFTASEADKVQVRLVNEIGFLNFMKDYLLEAASSRVGPSRVVHLERFDSWIESVDRLKQVKKMGQLRRCNLVRRLNSNWQSGELLLGQPWVDLTHNSLGVIGRRLTGVGLEGNDDEPGLEGTGRPVPTVPRTPRVGAHRKPWPTIEED